MPSQDHFCDHSRVIAGSYATPGDLSPGADAATTGSAAATRGATVPPRLWPARLREVSNSRYDIEANIALASFLWSRLSRATSVSTSG